MITEVAGECKYEQKISNSRGFFGSQRAESLFDSGVLSKAKNASAWSRRGASRPLAWAGGHDEVTSDRCRARAAADRPGTSLPPPPHRDLVHHDCRRAFPGSLGPGQPYGQRGAGACRRFPPAVDPAVRRQRQGVSGNRPNGLFTSPLTGTYPSCPRMICYFTQAIQRPGSVSRSLFQISRNPVAHLQFGEWQHNGGMRWIWLRKSKNWIAFMN